MSSTAAVFAQTYEDYLARIKQMDLSSRQDLLGVRVTEGSISVPFFNQTYRIGAGAITDPRGRRPDFAICVVLCKYLLLCPDQVPDDDTWVSFKDFKESAPLISYFVNAVENPIASLFSGRLPALKQACRQLGTILETSDLAYDLVARFDPLPRIALWLLFNDADKDFPAVSRILFERRAEQHLDAECLAMLGGILHAHLKLIDSYGP
jgi:hypothetical protein